MTDDAATTLLEEERSRLLGALGALGTDVTPASAGDAQDVTEGGILLAERQESAIVREELLADLARVDAALARVKDGTYGRCTVCGAAIADERLQALPTAQACVAHQRQREQRVGLSH